MSGRLDGCMYAADGGMRCTAPCVREGFAHRHCSRDADCDARSTCAKDNGRGKCVACAEAGCPVGKKCDGATDCANDLYCTNGKCSVSGPSPPVVPAWPWSWSWGW